MSKELQWSTVSVVFSSFALLHHSWNKTKLFAWKTYCWILSHVHNNIETLLSLQYHEIDNTIQRQRFILFKSAVSVSLCLSLLLFLSHSPCLSLCLLNFTVTHFWMAGPCIAVQQLQMAFPKTTVWNRIIIIITHEIQSTKYKVIFVIWRFVVSVVCILIRLHAQILPASVYLMCHNDDVRCVYKMLGPHIFCGKLEELFSFNGLEIRC